MMSPINHNIKSNQIMKVLYWVKQVQQKDYIEDQGIGGSIMHCVQFMEVLQQDNSSHQLIVFSMRESLNRSQMEVKQL
jgi:hypothetical protein